MPRNAAHSSSASSRRTHRPSRGRSRTSCRVLAEEYDIINRGLSMTETTGMVREALGELDTRHDHWKHTLVELCRIPSISASGFPPEEVRRSAEAMARTLSEARVEHVELLE